jgi:DtxR family Mn-dependent transcriptional regulator
MLNPTAQDYLKAIYFLSEAADDEPVATTALAHRMGVSAASVTGMLKRLAAERPALIHYRRYHGVRLTPAGERAALEILRHHRLLESYLTQALGFDWAEVHDEADRLEHVISETLEERIATALGNPAQDPHGDPIPDRDGGVPARRELTLAQLEAGNEAAISHVSDEDPALLRFLGENGLRPGSRVEVIEVGPFDGPIQVRVTGDGSLHTIGQRAAQAVFVAAEMPAVRHG